MYKRQVWDLVGDLPILFVSGYSWSALADQGIDADAVRIIQKPFTPVQLVEAVADSIPGSGR